MLFTCSRVRPCQGVKAVPSYDFGDLSILRYTDLETLSISKMYLSTGGTSLQAVTIMLVYDFEDLSKWRYADLETLSISKMNLSTGGTLKQQNKSVQFTCSRLSPCQAGMTMSGCDFEDLTKCSYTAIMTCARHMLAYLAERHLSQHDPRALWHCSVLHLYSVLQRADGAQCRLLM